jgi:ribonuclease P protein component
VLPRERRLTDSKAFGQVFRYGKGVSDSLLVLKARRLPGDEIRAGVSVSKKLGKAHVRNRVKRRVREALRVHLPRMKPGVHMVVVVKEGAQFQEYERLRASLEQLLKRASLLC